MKQKEFFGNGEKHVYVRKGDNGEILVPKQKTGNLSRKKIPFTLMYRRPVCLVFNYSSWQQNRQGKTE